MPLADLLSLVDGLGTGAERAHFDQHGPTVCPMAPRVDKNMDFRVTQISDCVIVSSEVSPAGVINLVAHCNTVALTLLQRGIMCRGYVTRGSIYHTDRQVMGSGYQNAYAAESGVTAFKKTADERGTPFIEIDKEVLDYIDSQSNDCVRLMFSRMVKRDQEIAAIFPFQLLEHSFLIAGFGVRVDPQKERKSNHNVRMLIRSIKDRVSQFVDPGNVSAVGKARHYLAALDGQLELCDKTDRFISSLG